MQIVLIMRFENIFNVIPLIIKNWYYSIFVLEVSAPVVLVNEIKVFSRIRNKID